MESGHSKRSLPVSVVLTNREIVSTSTVYSLPFPFFLITKYSFLNNLVRLFLGQNNNWLFCEYLLSSSSSLLANVSVLSKLVKFLHHINPTRQYPACVLSTHIENATFAGKPAWSYIFFIYLFLSFILRQDGTELIQNWRRKKSPHSIKDVNLRLFIYIGKLLYTHKFTRSLSLPEYLVRQAKNAHSFLTSKINNT